MPSYIEFLKQATLPSASDASKVVFGITDQGSITISDESGSAIGGGVVTVAPNAFFQMRDMGMLSPGTLYYLPGADANHGLYDGTDVIVQATSTSSYNPRGIGKFHNPKYDHSVLGFGIWTPRVRFQLSNISGSFQYNESVVNNNGNGCETVLSRQIFHDYGWNYIYPDDYAQWSGSLSITGSNSGATAEISQIEIPSYASGSKTIWGGKVWANKTGEVGNNNGAYELDNTNWEFVEYNDTDYNVVWDEIEYDVEHDFISMRKDKAGNIVEQSYAGWNWIEDRSMRWFPWGNELEYNNDIGWTGFANNTIKTSATYPLVNFRGQTCVDNIFDRVYMYDNTVFEEYAYMEQNEFRNTDFYTCFFSGDSFGFYKNKISNSQIGYIFTSGWGSINDNIIEQGSYLGNNSVVAGGSINHNTLAEDSYIGDNFLYFNSWISYNKIQNATIGDDNNYVKYFSGISNNTLDSYGWIGGNDLNNSYIQNNSLTSEGYIGDYNNMLNSGLYQNNLSNNSGIYSNEMTGSNIYDNTVTGESYINNNTLDNGGEIGKNTVTNVSSINNNTLIYNSCFIVENTVANQSSIDDNNFYHNSYCRQNTVTDSSYISGNNLATGSYIQANTVAGNSGLYSCILDSNSAFYANSIEMESGIYSITMYSSSYVESNKVAANSSISGMTLDPSTAPGNAYLYANTLQNTSTIYSNVIGVANISYNDLKNNSTIHDMTLGASAVMSYNSLSTKSSIRDINATAGNNAISANSLNNESSIHNFTMGIDETNGDNALFNTADITTSNLNLQFLHA